MIFPSEIKVYRKRTQPAKGR